MKIGSCCKKLNSLKDGLKPSIYDPSVSLCAQPRMVSPCQVQLCMQCTPATKCCYRSSCHTRTTITPRRWSTSMWGAGRLSTKLWRCRSSTPNHAQQCCQKCHTRHRIKTDAAMYATSSSLTSALPQQTAQHSPVQVQQHQLRRVQSHTRNTGGRDYST